MISKPITIKANELKEIIAAQLSNEFEKDGFTFKKSTNEFKHQDGDYTYSFYIEQLSWSGSHSINVHLRISQKKIESILEKILGKQRHKITMGRDIGDIYKSPDGRELGERGGLFIWLYQDEDIEATIKKLGMYYSDIAKPYFTKYNTLEAIDDIMNNPPFDYCPAHVGGNFNERCMKGLIVAKLINNPNYEKLVSIYNEEIKETKNTEIIEDYYKTRDYLIYNNIT